MVIATLFPDLTYRKVLITPLLGITYISTENNKGNPCPKPGIKPPYPATQSLPCYAEQTNPKMTHPVCHARLIQPRLILYHGV